VDTLAIVFDLKSAKVTAKGGGAVLDAAVDGDMAMIHLTKGFISVSAKQQGDAFTIDGEVDVLVDQSSEADALINGPWKFGFIQVARTKNISFTWSGRRDSEGEVDLVLSLPPAWPRDKLVSFDANPLNPPFMSAGPHLGFRSQEGPKIRVQISNSMGDHPNQRCSAKIPNSVTKATNFLSSIEREFEAFSIFCARDPTGKFEHLAHVRWTLSAEARFHWRAKKPILKQRVLGALKFDPPVQGPPSDPEVVEILANPGPPFHNDIADQAVPVALANHLNLREEPRRGLFITKDFFR
jgi:hypothetical protein